MRKWNLAPRGLVASSAGGDPGSNHVEAMESRVLMSTVSVSATQPIRTVGSNLTGTNLAWWQGELNTPQTQQLVTSAGLNLFRLPGGSAADANLHFNNPPPYNGYQTDPIMANFVQSVGGNAVVTVNYGTGSPQEAAAMLAYFNAKVGDATPIGVGQQWNTTTNTWVSVDWKTAGYWASLRAASPLAVDDGSNFLRVAHPAPWGFSYYEVGNEEYATWETDEHGSGGDTGLPHDPGTYIAFAKTFSDLAHQIDSAVKIGIDVSIPLKYNEPDLNWTGDLLKASVADGFVPGFFSDHIYITGLSDQSLLLDSVNDPTYINQDGVADSFAARASYYRNLLTQYFGTTVGGTVQLMATEFNSDLSSKQSVSLVNGLWVADAVGALSQTEYTSAIEWDLTNGYSPATADPTHYGWREGTDDGLISTGSSDGSTSGAYVPYPTYFAEQLLSKIYQNNGQVLPVSSSDPDLDVFAVKETSGHVELLVVNKSQAGLNNDTTGTPASITGTFSLAGFTPTAAATEWQYGSAQDDAQEHSTNGASALATSTVTIALNGGSFSVAFPSYSMSVIDLTPAVVIATGSVSGVVSRGGAGLGNVTVYLDANNNSVLDPGELSTVTTAAGSYTFTNVPAGAYVVRQVLPAGYSQTTPTQNYGDHVTVTAGSSNTGQNFVDQLIPTGATINGVVTAGGAGIAGETIYLDVNNNSKLDAGELSTVTTATGAYTFGNVPAGAYVVRQMLPAGYQQLTPTQQYGIHVTAVVGKTYTNENFTDAALAAGIAGEIFNDANGNARLDDPETGLAGWTVYLDLNNTGAYVAGDPVQTTDSLGHYSFTGLAAGAYLVRVVRPSTYRQTTPSNNFAQHVTLAVGQAVTGINLGEELIA